MYCLVCFVEERSAKIMLDTILSKMLPSNNISHTIIAFEGKQDLEKNIVKKLRGWQRPNSVFLIMRDQDTGDCRIIKQSLLEKVANSSKQAMSIVRIACHELESFYLGDLCAVEEAFGINNLASKQNKKKFRDPDNKVLRAKKELQKIAETYQPISGSRKIAKYLKLDNTNKSISFNILLEGIRQLIKINNGITP